MCTISSVSESGDMESKNQCGDLENPTTLCKIDSINMGKLIGI